MAFSIIMLACLTVCVGIDYLSLKRIDQNGALLGVTLPPDAAALPQTGTTSWMAGVLASLGSLLLACGWFFTRKQVSPKH